jgi:hypothetical protein
MTAFGCGHFGGVGAGLTVFSYFKRFRVQVDGTEQSSPPLPDKNAGPSWPGILFSLARLRCCREIGLLESAVPQASG